MVDTSDLGSDANRCESSSLSEGTNEVNMIREFKFYKDEGGWFVDLPEWEGTKADLAMVSGADTMMDIISQGENDIKVLLSTEEFDGSNRLEFLRESPEVGEGSWYLMKSYKGIEYNLELWLCNVTIFVFGNFPKYIYVS
jgi:hypothetical protein